MPDPVRCECGRKVAERQADGSFRIRIGRGRDADVHFQEGTARCTRCSTEIRLTKINRDESS